MLDRRDKQFPVLPGRRWPSAGQSAPSSQASTYTNTPTTSRVSKAGGRVHLAPLAEAADMTVLCAWGPHGNLRPQHTCANCTHTCTHAHAAQRDGPASVPRPLQLT